MSEQPPQTSRIPVVPGFIQDHPEIPTLHVWCAWCLRWHEHGLAGTKVGDTADRAAHCYAPDSPYKDTGYNILVSDVPFSAVADTMRKATAAQQRAIRDGRITPTVQLLRDQEPPAA